MQNQEQVKTALSNFEAAQEETARAEQEVNAAKIREDNARLEAGRLIKAVYGVDKEVVYGGRRYRLIGEAGSLGYSPFSGVHIPKDEPPNPKY